MRSVHWLHKTCGFFLIPSCFYLFLTSWMFAFRDLLQDFPALSSLQCVVGAVCLSSSTQSVVPSSTPTPEDTSMKEGPTRDADMSLESVGEDPSTQNFTETLESKEGGSDRIQPKFRSMITPPENSTWTTAQLAPFVQRLAPGQPVEGKGGHICCFLSSFIIAKIITLVSSWESSLCPLPIKSHLRSKSSQMKWNVAFEQRGKPEYSGKNLSERSKEPTNSIYVWRRVRESNSAHIGGRKVQSPPRQFWSSLSEVISCLIFKMSCRRHLVEYSSMFPQPSVLKARHYPLHIHFFPLLDSMLYHLRKLSLNSL